jgi:hypothetical protein
MKPDRSTLLSRERGTLPDRYWYQINGKSAQENYAEQKQRILAELNEEEEDSVHITSEVEVK